MFRSPIPVVAGTALVIALAGCTASESTDESGPSSTDGTAQLEVTEVNVGLVPVADTATAYLALDLGYFEEAGLTVTMEQMQNAASIVPGVMNGQIQFGGAAVPPMISAAAEGLPIKMVANGGNVPSQAGGDTMAIVAKPGSGITTGADLNGKTVAVNALQALADLVTRQAITVAGGDVSTVTLVAMPFPDINAAIERGDVDAGFQVEPFVTIANNSGLEIAFNPYAETLVPGGTESVFFASDEFIAQAPNTVAAFTAALDRAAEDAAEDPQLIRDILVEYGNVDPGLAEAMALPEYSAGISEEAVQRFADIMVEQGFLTDVVPSVDQIIHQ